jgi:hypothetical protein
MFASGPVMPDIVSLWEAAPWLLGAILAYAALMYAGQWIARQYRKWKPRKPVPPVQAEPDRPAVGRVPIRLEREGDVMSKDERNKERIGIAALAADLCLAYEPEAVSARINWKASCLSLAEFIVEQFPADDETPIDEAWLRSVGFTPTDNCPSEDFRWLTLRWLTHGLMDIAIEEGTPDATEVRFEEEFMPIGCRYYTRGSVRLLCKFLGVPLTEAK